MDALNSRAERQRGFWQLLKLGLVTAILASASAHAAIVYSVNTTIISANPTGNPLQSDTVLGSITTNGTIGVLATADILSWNLSLIDNLNAANNFVLTPGNSTLAENFGGALSANADSLFFDFSKVGAEFLIQANNPGVYSGWHYFCFSATGGACLAGETISPQYYSGDGVVATGAAAPIGMQPLGPPTAPGTVPEPSTYYLMLAGLLGLIGARRKALI